MNRKYTVDDSNPISWDEFGNLTTKLLNNIQVYLNNHKISLDAIAPILRNGAIPGTIIANKLEITTLLPVQVKYDYGSNRPEQLLPFCKPLTSDLGEKPKILVTECNTFSGESARLTAEIIKKTYPKASLFYATVTRVFRKPEINLPLYEEYFYGVMTNENFEAKADEVGKLRLRKGITIYPWETPEKELKDINEYFSTQ